MAEDSDQERTEEPSAKRLSEAREKGQIPRSRELNTLAMLLSGSVAMFMFGSYIVQTLWKLMEGDFRLSRHDLLNPSAIGEHLLRDFWATGKLLGPFLALTVLVALAAPLSLGGWNFSSEAFEPKLEKLDPLKGLARMVSPQALIELVKALLKFLLIGGVTALLFRHYFYDFLHLSRQGLEPATARAVELIMWCLLFLCGSLALIAAIDAPFQWWNWKRQLRMTKQEIRDEARDLEGKPEVKSRIRSLQMEYARRRMMEEVPKADVVVTNPTHYAVALKYDQGRMGAPRVVAKGADLIAAQIRNLAVGAGVPLLAAPPLARALYFSTDVEKEIPAGLYLAVAQVLAYVYQLKAARQYGGDIPVPPEDLEVPDEFLRETR
ncbi:flagellar biosynthesis protein FlhB [Methylococcus sp. EFPC2]|uniref:flagellar biosynthesis protein FlhB n=1 Tax=Methylococcus sp. EFPC2 TaxID=2812648 RepID=UPI001967CB40|nr:flagellar biosynthesis protein FlhB [Methylococcus sp. EFPC2]QSA97637.1 flagellar type III secretion system protein FlhB [Methylococcus sp. EFPC2]